MITKLSCDLCACEIKEKKLLKIVKKNTIDITSTFKVCKLILCINNMIPTKSIKCIIFYIIF